MAGRDRPASFESVSAYWFEGVDKGLVGHGSMVRIRGIVSMYVPATPRHPSSIPGRQLETWLNARAPTSNFAHHDFLLWNDGILAPPPAQSRKAVLGLNDRYGFVGQGGVPIIVDLTNPKQKSAYERINLAKPTGFECTVTGKLTPFATPEILAFGFVNPQPMEPQLVVQPNLPTFVIEAHELELGEPHSMILGTIWMGLKNDEILPIYCNLFDRTAHAKAISALNQEYGRLKSDLAAVYDLEPFYRKHDHVPPLNQDLVQLFKKF